MRRGLAIAVVLIAACKNRREPQPVPASSPSPSLVAPGASDIFATWTNGKLTALDCQRGRLMPCIPD